MVALVQDRSNIHTTPSQQPTAFHAKFFLEKILCYSSCLKAQVG